MSLFGLSGKEIDKFAKELAQELAKQYPPAMENPPATGNAAASSVLLSEGRLTRILEELYRKGENFKSQHKLGVYKKARLANTFRWELDTLGYSKKFIEIATEGMVVTVTRKRRSSTTAGT